MRLREEAHSAREVPDDYIRVSSILGSATPLNIIILPVLFEGEVKAVIELASLRKFGETHLSFLDQLTESIAVSYSTPSRQTCRTESLLEQSQSLTKELQTQQEEAQGNQRPSGAAGQNLQIRKGC